MLAVVTSFCNVVIADAFVDILVVLDVMLVPFVVMLVAFVVTEESNTVTSLAF